MICLEIHPVEKVEARWELQYFITASWLCPIAGPGCIQVVKLVAPDTSLPREEAPPKGRGPSRISNLQRLHLDALAALLTAELPPTFKHGGKNGVYLVDKMEISGKIPVDRCLLFHSQHSIKNIMSRM